MVDPGEKPNRGGTESEGHDTPEATGATAPPSDLKLVEEVPDVFKRVWHVYARNLWALLLVAGLPVAPLVLLAQIHVVWPASEGVYLNGVLETSTDPAGIPVLVVLGTLALLGLLIAPIPLGGSVLLGGGALLGRRITVPSAWRGAVQRYFTTLAWALLVLVLVGSALALALWLLSRGWGLFPIGLVLLPPLLFLLVPLSVLLPVALLEGHGPFRGLAAAWRIGRHRRGTHFLLVGSSYGVSVLAGTVLERSLLRWTDLAADDLVLVSATSAAAVLAAPLSVLLMCAPAVYTGVSTGCFEPTVDLDLGLSGHHLPEPRTEGARPRARHLVTVPLLVAVLLAPPLLGPAAVAANPFGLPELTASPPETVRGDDLVVDVAAKDGGALIGTARRGAALERCDPHCSTEVEVQMLKGGSGVSVEDGTVLRTLWREFEHDEDSDLERGAPHPDSGLYLTVCEDARECDESDEGVLLRPFDGRQFDLSSTAAPLADRGLIVASHVRHDDRRDPGEAVDGDTGGLRLHVCDDTACETPRSLDLPPELTVGGFLLDGAFLDAAGSPEGGFSVAAMDPTFGTLSLVTCADDDCSEPETTEVFADQFRDENEDRLRAKFGARVEYRSDGTPVATYRDVGTGEARLVDCHDALCSEFTDSVVTGPGWARPTPGLAVDSQDRPQLLTPDMGSEQLALLSCLDRACTDTVKRALVDFENEPAVTALALDGDDRPHMVWSHGSLNTFSSAHRFDADSLYLSCSEPYCGAEPDTP